MAALAALTLVTGSIARADGLGSLLFQVTGGDNSACEKILSKEAADKVADAGTDVIKNKGSGLIEFLVGKFRHTVSSLEEHDYLGTGGLTGRFLNPLRVDGLSREANRILGLILADSHQAEKLGQQMLRLGLFPKKGKDSTYSKFWVLARNESIDLQHPQIDGHDIQDDRVRSYLESLLKQIKKTGSDSTVLSPERPSHRLDVLYAMIRTALAEIEPSDRDNSLKSLDMALTEIGRLQTTTGLTATQALTQVFEKLNGTAVFTVRQVKVPVWARAILTVAPWATLAFKMWDMVNQAFYKESGLASDRHDVEKIDIWHKRAPSTLHIRFASRDVRNLQPLVQIFIAKYTGDKAPSVYTNEFANDFMTAYPEVREYFTGHYTNERLPVDQRAGDAFQSFHPEVQKILYKAANFLAILRNEPSAFPEMDPAQLAQLQKVMIQELSLADADGKINGDAIDLMLTTFVASALGKARSSVVDSIADEYGVGEKAGNYDYSRRTLYLLHHYRILSYSFSRQNPANQKFITEILDNNYQASLPELLRMEAPKTQFDLLQTMDPSHLNFLFYQHLVSETKESQHGMTLTPHVLATWLQLKGLLVRDTNPFVTRDEAYNTYVQWLKQGMSLDTSSEWGRVKLRMATIMGLPHGEAHVLFREMALLNGHERELFIWFMERHAVFFHRAADLFRVILLNATGRGASLETAIDEYLEMLSRMFAAIEHRRFDFMRIDQSSEPERMYLRPVIEFVQADDFDPRGIPTLNFGLHTYTYGDVVHVLESR